MVDRRVPRFFHRTGRALLPACVVVSFAFTHAAVAVEIIGHRGASHDAPENTLASINLAWTQHADAAEIDVYLSKDGEIVTIHDANTRRVGGRNRRVVDQTLAELKELDIGRWKDPKWTGERIPTLTEVLATIPDGKRLFIEIKCGPEIASRMVEVIREAGKRPEQTCFISFSYDTVARLKKDLPAIKSFWIVELKQDKQSRRWQPALDELIAKVKAAKLDGLDFGNAPVIDKDFVGLIRQAGLEVYIWTVDGPRRAEQLAKAGVNGITTNRPGFLKEHFRGRP
jgi:glycerophosphoryl diester phosphodiesterase